MCPDTPPAFRSLSGPIIRMGTVTSTMDIARRLDRLGAAEGTTVIATAQTAGRGRAGRVWQSPPSTGLYCSILLRPRIAVERFQPFSLVAGLALCDALDPDHRKNLALKWPNDLLVQDRKLAGILIATELSGSIVESAILGIGLNLTSDPNRPPHAIALTEIAQSPPPPTSELVDSIWTAIRPRYTALLDLDPTRALAGWNDRLAFLGDLVTIQDGPNQLTGRLTGFDPSGTLHLETASGPISISSGTLTRGPRLHPSSP